MNTITISGNLTDTPKLRDAGENKVCEFTLAVSRGDKKDTTDFIRCSAWNKLAEIVASHTTKGDKLVVQGQLNIDNYEKNGEKRSSSIVVARNIEFMFKKAGDTESDSQSDSQPIEDDTITEGELPF